MLNKASPANNVLMSGSFSRNWWSRLLAFGLVTIFFLAFSTAFSPAEQGGWGGPYLGWMQSYKSDGLVAGYYSINDIYPPGVYSILALFSHIAGGGLQAFKLSQEIFFLAASALVLVETKDVSVVFLFQLSIFVAQIIFSSVDIYFAPFLIASLMLLRRDEFLLSALSFSCAVLIKWQPIFLAPFFLIYLTRYGGSKTVISRWLQSLVGASLVLGAAFCIFGVEFTHKLFSAGADAATAFSAYAFNLGWLISYCINHHALVAVIPLHSVVAHLMQLSFLGIMIALLVRMYGSKGHVVTFGELVTAMTLGYASFLVVYPGINSNYWIVLPCLLIFLSDFLIANLIIMYVAIMGSVNVLFLRAFLHGDSVFLFGRGGFVSIILSAVNVLALGVILVVYLNVNSKIRSSFRNE